MFGMYLGMDVQRVLFDSSLTVAEPLVVDERREVQREILPGEFSRIELEDILVLPKQSKVEWDLKKRGVSLETLFEQYDEEGVDRDEVWNAHIEHNKSLEVLIDEIGPSQVLLRELYTPELLKERIDRARVVLVAGGDDHLKYVSHFIKDTFVVPVNTDPERSTGALMTQSVKGLGHTLQALREGKFLVEEWQRIDTELNGKKLPPCLSEIYIGEEKSKMGSRVKVKYWGREATMKGSGVLIATGAGSTGWFKSASRYLFSDPQLWARTSPHLEFVQREPYGEITTASLLHGSIEQGQALEIVSTLNHGGELSIDSLSDHAFPRGSVAVLRVSDQPLNVLKMMDE